MCGRLRFLCSRFLHASLTVVILALSVSSATLRGRKAPVVTNPAAIGLPSRFGIGAHVRVNGLQSSVDLNGKDGTVQTFDVLSGRYIVQIGEGVQPKKIRPEHLVLLDESPNSGDDESQNSDDSASAPHYNPGSRVILFGLHRMRALNGMQGVVRHFDAPTGRYVIDIAGQPPRKIKPENMQPASRPENMQPASRPVEQSQSPLRSVCESQSDEGPSKLPRGTKVVLHGLQSAAASAWNGLVATVHCFDGDTQRYVVALPDGTPRKIKPSNLHREGDEGEPVPQHSTEPLGEGREPTPQDSTDAHGLSEAVSICKQQASHGFIGPGGFAIGSKVQLHGLQSAAARDGHWNGMAGVVHCFDVSSERYVVACADGTPRKIKPTNLMVVGAAPSGDKNSSSKSVCQQQAAKGFVGPGGIAIGSKVLVHGLTSAAAIKGGLNGMVGVVHCFDSSSNRYVVACPDGMPRKLKVENLRPSSAEEQNDALALPHSQGKPQSICQPQVAQGVVGPGGLAAGMKVALFGLTSQAAMKGHWNGMVGVVHCYDATSQRYVVAMADGSPRRLKVENLAIVTNAVTQAAPKKVNSSLQLLSHPVHWIKGAYVRLLGLKVATELNGQVGNVVDFENATQRYVVKVPGSTKLKRVKAANLADVAVSEAVAPPMIPAIAAVAQVAGTQQQPDGRQLVVCNAYATHSPIQVFAMSGDGKHYNHVVKSLDFQACSDVQNVPVDRVASLVFVIGKFQVAKKNVDLAGLTPGQGLELVVHRNDPNSLKAAIHENPVELGDNEAYYLHLVNAYAGHKPLELQVRRGSFAQKMPLDKTYRLSSEQAIKMVLSDGTQKLKLTFQPKRGGTYCVMTTGVDPGLKGEPRNVGLVAHQIGAWTSSEEMDNEDTNQGGSKAEEWTSQARSQAPDVINHDYSSKDSIGQSRPSFSFSSILGKLFSHS